MKKALRIYNQYKTEMLLAIAIYITMIGIYLLSMRHVDFDARIAGREVIYNYMMVYDIPTAVGYFVVGCVLAYFGGLYISEKWDIQIKITKR